MPRLGNRVPKYRKHKQSGQAIVTLNGRDHLLGPYGTKASHAEWDRLVSEWLATGRSSSYGSKEPVLSITELAVDYVEHAKAYYGSGPNSELHRIVRALRPVRELYGPTPAVEFGVLQFEAVRQKLLARTYINATMRRVARAFKWSASKAKIPADIPMALSMVPGLLEGHTTAHETRPVEPVKEHLVDATLLFLPRVVADMVRVQRYTGCRPAEVCMIRPCDIDRSGEIWEYRPRTHKTKLRGKKRVVFLGPKAQHILGPYLDRDPEAHCFQPSESEAKRRAAQHAARTTPLSCGNVPGSNRASYKRRRPPGESYDPRAYHQAIRNACRKAFPVPVPLSDDSAAAAKWRSNNSWFPNQLRHSAATEIRKLFGLEAAQTVLGHSKADVTQVYAERDYALAANVARLIG
jgi:integrase